MKPNPTTDEINEIITNAIHKSSEMTIPTQTREKEHKPWVNNTFLELVNARNQSKSKLEQEQLNKKVKSYRDKLKNEYYQRKASEINMESELRDVEKEFRIAKDYDTLRKSKRVLIAPEKLKQHFEGHFAPTVPSASNYTPLCEYE